MISIILPIKNEDEKLLSSLFEALTLQHPRHVYEVVIVDESDPDHFKHVERFTELLKRSGIKVKLIHDPSIGGVGYACIRGLIESEGTFVFFLDADNILDRTFIESLYNILANEKWHDIAFVSFLSRGVYRKSWINRFFLPARYVLSTFEGGLKFMRKYGFVNTLRLWNKEFLRKNVGFEILYPKLSYQDQPFFWERVRDGLNRGYRTVHIDKVLVYDVRHLYEDYSPKFIHSRIRWYLKAVVTRNIGTKLPSVCILPFLLPLFTALIVASLIFSPWLLLSTCIGYLLLFTVLCLSKNIPLLNLTTIVAAIFIPVVLLIESLSSIATLSSIALERLRKL